MINIAEQSPLGKTTVQPCHYSADLLFPIAREIQRKKWDFSGKLPFFGADIWNAYELSWLEPKGKPTAAMATIRVPCTSPNLVESKSLKLYFNSFNQKIFLSEQEVKETIINDLSNTCKEKVDVTIHSVDQSDQFITWEGTCLDERDVTINHYTPTPTLLQTERDEIVQETLYSHLLKSNCLVTKQPDWASIWINYQGPKIDHDSLLKYIISFRFENGFHEDCVEQIFMDLLERCLPTELTVYARYTRRGGIDINPFRSTRDIEIENGRLIRQ